MVLSGLHSFPFFDPTTGQNPLPTQTTSPQQLRLSPSINALPALSLQPKTQIVIPTILPKHPLKINYTEQKECPFQYLKTSYSVSVAFPSLQFANTLYFKSAYNVQVIVRDEEPEEKLIGRFRREVFKAGVIQECKNRRFFETTQEKKKRKTREAARRNRKRRPQPKAIQQVKEEALKKKDDFEDDNWEFIDGDLPYC